MKKKIIAVISGAVILIIAAGSIYGKPESSHKEGENEVYIGNLVQGKRTTPTIIKNVIHLPLLVLEKIWMHILLDYTINNFK